VIQYCLCDITIPIRTYGPKYENGEWKSRMNRELEELSKGENTVKWIKGHIGWLGNLEGMEDTMPKKIFTQELEGMRQRGRPRKGWREVERDLQVMGVRRWRELVIDRENGGDLFNRPKPTAGCSANRRRNDTTVSCESSVFMWLHTYYIVTAACVHTSNSLMIIQRCQNM
jgi:hypothetical protein